MALQKTIIKRTGYDQSGAPIGSTAALATGIPGERADTAPCAEHTVTTTAEAKFGNYIAGEGLVVNPKEHVRYGGSIADSLKVAAGTVVAVATMGHYFTELVLSAKTAIAKGALLKVGTDGGLAVTTTASEAVAKVLEAVAYTAPVEASEGVEAVAEKGAEQFKPLAGNKFGVIVKIGLV